MTKIHSLKISHYRAFEHFEQTFPEENLIMFIGRGDSGKTTLLNAIQRVLSPAWNLSFSDYDFYNLDTSVAIQIECSLIDIPSELMSENKYGFYLQYLRNDGSITGDVLDEDVGNRPILTIRLTVNDDLEPHWKVTTLRGNQEDKEISANDRAKLNMFMVSDYIDNHFTYSKMSPLYALLRQNLDDKSQIDKKLTELARKAFSSIADNVQFDEFDQSLKDLASTANVIGIDVNNIKASLEYQDKTFTEGSISLQKDKLPYRLHGKGSKRLLSLALQNLLSKEGGITLLDEVEQGLEPDRIVNLIRFLRKQSSVQVFLTTHSSYALVEADWKNVFLLRKDASFMISFQEQDQAILRSQPESFFAKKVICCEGKTEQGVLRALDECLETNEEAGFTSKGTVVANCKGGDKFYKNAQSFKAKGYETAIFADNDVNKLKKNAEEAEKNGIKLWIWDEGKSLEQQVFNDLPWTSIVKLITDLNNKRPDLNIYNHIHIKEDKELLNANEAEQIKQRKDIGEYSKKLSWFKNFPGGELIGFAIYSCVKDKRLDKKTTLYKNINSLIEWVKK